MGALLGLMLGAGLVLMWAALRGDGWRPRRPTTASRVEALLGRAGVEGITPLGVALLCLSSGTIVGTVMLAVSRTGPVAAAFAIMATYLPLAALRGRARRRQRELAELWPEAVDNLASAVRAGLSLPEALTQLGERGPEPLREPFIVFSHDYQASGRFNDCLDLLKQRLADPVGDRVVEALRIARDVGGGDLGRMLRSLSGFLRDDARTRAELESRQSWTINGARLAVAAPWLVLLMLSFQPDVIHRYASTGGVLVLGTGAGVCFVAYRLMAWLGRLPIEQRVLG
ncbi:MAG: type II secretion system F family protein [Actinobacteria bacterium]|nr:type II secretion system F family protein [Actinomycetota bacterium]